MPPTADPRSERAFGALFERHRRELRVHCYHMLGSLDEAEDLVQETFLRAWKGIGGLDRRQPSPGGGHRRPGAPRHRAHAVRDLGAGDRGRPDRRHRGVPRALRFGLVDEIHLIVAPVVVGGGKPSLPDHLRAELVLADERSFAGGMVHLRYRIVPDRSA